MYHETPDKSYQGLFAAIGRGGHSEYKAAGANYTVQKVIQAISDLRGVDQRLKGIGNSTTSDSDQLREFVFGFMN
ncbi:MAG: hypothetical protein ACJA15_000866 [Flavobacteriales bacterium]